MVKTIIKIVLFITLIGVLFHYGFYVLNYNVLISGLSNFKSIYDYLAFFIELLFKNSYFVLFASIALLCYLFNKMFI